MRMLIPARPDFRSVPVRKAGLALAVAGLLAGGGYVAGQGSMAPPAAKPAERVAMEPAVPVVVLAKGDRTFTVAEPSLHDLLNPPAEAPARAAPPFVRAATQATVAPAPKPAPGRVAGERKVAMPVGVERFDNCGSTCESRDPKRLGAAPVAAAPAPVAVPPPAVAQASAGEAESGYGLPDIVGASKNLYERTAAATSATVDTVKQGMQSVIDVVW
ncbi:hypothetical protein [Ancylobacter terrae]|uniref:hypothetical protein n=1 Tax=Ancylobacter sp. sgz301288 TaxID=3342077 RepID=UPI00385B27E0